MGSALNLIIARGFDGATRVADSYYAGQDQAREQNRQDAATSNIQQRTDLFRQQTEADMDAQAADRQAATDASAEAAAIMQEAGRLSQAYQANPNDPQIGAQMQALVARAQGIVARKDPASVVDMLLPQQAGGGVLGADDAAALGFRTGTIVGRDANGNLRVLQTPDATPAAAAMPAVKPPAGYRPTPEGNLEPIPGGPADSSTPKLSAKDQSTARAKMISLRVARNQLATIKQAFDKLKDSYSAGPGGGYLPTEVGRSFDAAVNQFRQTLTSLTRTPGIGAMSDFETRLAMSQLPSRNEYESVTQQQIDGLQSLIDALDEGYAGMSAGNARQPASSGQSPPSAAAPAGQPSAQPAGRPVSEMSDEELLRALGGG